MKILLILIQSAARRRTALQGGSFFSDRSELTVAKKDRDQNRHRLRPPGTQMLPDFDSGRPLYRRKKTSSTSTAVRKPFRTRRQRPDDASGIYQVGPL